MQALGQDAIGWGGGRQIMPAWPRRGVHRLRRRPIWRTFDLLGAVPRGAGLGAALLFIAAFAGYGMVLSSTTAQFFDHTAANFGFAIHTIHLSGQREVQVDAIVEKLDLPAGGSMFTFDAAAARRRIAEIPWIKSVSIMKLYPATLEVAVEERTPYALWQQSVGGTVSIIDAEGAVIGGLTDARFAGLPVVVGDGAAQRADTIEGLLDNVPALKARVRASILVGQRRWDLILDNGVQIELPEEDPGTALTTIARLDATTGLLSRDIVLVDMRLPDQLVVRLTDGAYARHLDDIKTRSKATGAAA